MTVVLGFCNFCNDWYSWRKLNSYVQLLALKIATEILAMLKAAYKDSSIRNTHVFEWFSHIKICNVNCKQISQSCHERITFMAGLLKMSTVIMYFPHQQWVIEEIVNLQMTKHGATVMILNRNNNTLSRSEIKN